MSENTVSVSKDSVDNINVYFDTKYLAPGKYRTKFSFFNVNAFGTPNYLCIVPDFMQFSLSDDGEILKGFSWERRSWGYFSFIPLKIGE